MEPFDKHEPDPQFLADAKASVSQPTADYLNLELLLLFACDRVARAIRGFSPVETVEFFHYSLSPVKEEFLDILNLHKQEIPEFVQAEEIAIK
ncbi:hypothetical protein PTKIN_Ptkin12aG0194400 [Pterospermum kingtungense]